MQQAILITAYTNIEHLFDVICSFNANYNIYIHIDKKSKVRDKDISRLLSKGNVFLSCKYNVNWGGINHLKAILLLLQEAFKNEENEYFHLITGHDFPIKSSSEIEAFLHNNNRKNFIEYSKYPIKEWEYGGYNRILYYNLYDCVNARKGWQKAFVRNVLKFQRLFKIKRNFPKNFPKDIYGGSTYWSLNREIIEYVFKYMSENPQYLKRFEYTFCSEEIFFQTILLNSPLKDTIVNNNLRFIVWEERNGNIPANLDESDFEAIKNSDAFFARKFEYPVSIPLLEQIKKYLKMKEN